MSTAAPGGASDTLTNSNHDDRVKDGTEPDANLDAAKPGAPSDAAGDSHSPGTTDTGLSDSGEKAGSSQKTKSSETKVNEKRSFTIAGLNDGPKQLFSQKKHKVQKVKQVKKRDILLKEERFQFRNVTVEPYAVGRKMWYADRINARYLNKVAARRGYAISASLSQVPSGEEKTGFPIASFLFYSEQRNHGKSRKKLSEQFSEEISSFPETYSQQIVPQFLQCYVVLLQFSAITFAAHEKGLNAAALKNTTRTNEGGTEKHGSKTGTNESAKKTGKEADLMYIDKVCPAMFSFFDKKLCEEEETSNWLRAHPLFLFFHRYYQVLGSFDYTSVNKLNKEVKLLPEKMGAALNKIKSVKSNQKATTPDNAPSTVQGAVSNHPFSSQDKESANHENSDRYPPAMQMKMPEAEARSVCTVEAAGEYMKKVVKTTYSNRLSEARTMLNEELLFPALLSRLKLDNFKMVQGIPDDTAVEADESLKNANRDKAVASYKLPEAKSLSDSDNKKLPALMRNMRMSSNPRAIEKHLDETIIDHNKKMFEEVSKKLPHLLWTLDESCFVVAGEASSSALRLTDLSKTPLARQTSTVSILNIAAKTLITLCGAPTQKIYLASSKNSIKTIVSLALSLNFVLKELLGLQTSAAEEKYGGAMTAFYVTKVPSDEDERSNFRSVPAGKVAGVVGIKKPLPGLDGLSRDEKLNIIGSLEQYFSAEDVATVARRVLMPRNTYTGKSIVIDDESDSERIRTDTAQDNSIHDPTAVEVDIDDDDDLF